MRLSGIRRVFRHDRDTGVDVELQFHIDARTDDLVRAGLEPDDARRQALAEFGDIARYQTETLRIDRGHVRATRVKEFLWSVWYDVGYSARGLSRSPAFAAAAILTLAMGIGANTAVWTILDALMRRPLPIERPSELHTVIRTGQPDEQTLSSLPRFHRFQAAVPDGRALAAMSAFAGLYATDGDQPEPVTAQLVSGNWFEVLGVGVRLGRPVGPDDDRLPNGLLVAVLTDGFWARRFGRDPGIVGSTIRVNGAPVRVIGVAEAGFQGLTIGQSVDVWMPLAAQSAVRLVANFSAVDADPEKPWPLQDGLSWLTVIARVAPEEAPRYSAAIDRQFRAELEDNLTRMAVGERELRLREHLTLQAIPRGLSSLRQTFRDPLYVLMASVGLILLIACANLAGLFLARSSARSQDIAIRISLGARRSRLVRQMLTDSLVVALLGGALSLAVAHWGTTMLLRAASSGPQPVPLAASMDVGVIAFALAVSIGTGLLVGALPAVRVSHVRLYDAFRASGRATGGRAAHRLPLGRILVTSQIALSLVLVVTAGVFVQTLRNLLDIDPGYDRDRVVLARIDARAARIDTTALAAFYDGLLRAATGIPGVTSASISLLGVAGAQITSTLFIPGRPPGANVTQENLISPGFFSTVGMPLLEGRDFTAADRNGAPRVAIVSESMARHFFGARQALGARFGRDTVADIEVVGVVRDARVNELREAPPRIVYYPLAQGPQSYATSLEVRVAGPAAPVVASLREALRREAPALPVRDVVTVSDLLERGLTRERLVARLAGSFGMLALLLAAVGLYGVVGYSVARRTNEMGVRLALGASPGAVRGLVLRESIGLSIAGVVVGLGLLVPVQGLVGGLVYGMSPRDPATVAGAVVALLAVTVAAAFIPAWRASRIDPVDAIRSA